MKTIKLLAALFTSFSIQSISAQIDLEIGNANGGYDSYNSTTGIIKGVYFDALNNENGKAGPFRIALFLVDPNDFNTRYEVYSIDDNGQNGNTLVEYTNIDINFNNTPNIPAGDYRLLVWIDVDKIITETNEDNNALYLTAKGSDLSFSPSTGIIEDDQNFIHIVNMYPNPTVDEINFVLDNVGDAKLKFMDISGRMIQETVVQKGNNTINISNLSAGVYFCQLIDENNNIIAIRKIIKK